LTFRAKITLSSSFFLAVSVGVGGWCYFNIQREEIAFAASRRAARTHAAVSDIEYFLNRQVRALQNYVLLGDEAEKLQLQQAEGRTKNLLTQWKDAAARREAFPEEVSAVEAAQTILAAPSKKIQGILDDGGKAQAMGLVDKEFVPASVKALAAFKEVKARTEAAAATAESAMRTELRRNHLFLLAGLGLVVFFGLVFLISFGRSVLRPIRLMRAWADRVAKGERNVPWQFPGRNELTELAASLGEMAIQLTRPNIVDRPVNEIFAATAPRHPVSAPDLPPSPAAGANVIGTVSAPPPSPESTLPPAKAAAALREKELEDAVEGFREILAQMAGRTDHKPKETG